jgi:hypothetical protein
MPAGGASVGILGCAQADSKYLTECERGGYFPEWVLNGKIL